MIYGCYHMNIKTSTKESGFTMELDSMFQDEFNHEKS